MMPFASPLTLGRSVALAIQSNTDKINQRTEIMANDLGSLHKRTLVTKECQFSIVDGEEVASTRKLKSLWLPQTLQRTTSPQGECEILLLGLG